MRRQYGPGCPTYLIRLAEVGVHVRFPEVCKHAPNARHRRQADDAGSRPRRPTSERPAVALQKTTV